MLKVTITGVVPGMGFQSHKKMLKVNNMVVVLFMVSMALTLAFAEDWSQFRGPNGSGVSTSTGLPAEFGPEKNVIWKTALPPGHSSPVLTRNRIFVTAHSQRKGELQATRHLSRPPNRKAPLATRSAALECRPLAERQRARLAKPGHRRLECLRLLSRVRVGLVRRSRQRALEASARTVQHVLRLWRIPDPR